MDRWMRIAECAGACDVRDVKGGAERVRMSTDRLSDEQRVEVRASRGS